MEELRKLQDEYNLYCFQLQGEVEGSTSYSLLVDMMHSVLDDIEEAQQLSNVKAKTSTVRNILKESENLIPTHIKGKYTTIGMN